MTQPWPDPTEVGDVSSWGSQPHITLVESYVRYDYSGDLASTIKIAEKVQGVEIHISGDLSGFEKGPLTTFTELYVRGDILNDVFSRGQSFVSSVEGDILGDVSLFNAGFSYITIGGSVDDFLGTNLWGAHHTIAGDAESYDGRGFVNGSLTIGGHVEVLSITNSFLSEAHVNSIEGGLLKIVNSNAYGIDITDADSAFVSIGGKNGRSSHDVDIDIESADGAFVAIRESSADASVTTQSGDAFYVDRGINTSIDDGDGNSFMILQGCGDAHINGGGGNDTIATSHQDGTATLTGGSGADAFMIMGVDADIVITDFNPDDGDTGTFFTAGGVALDLDELMELYGEDSGHGSTLIELGGTSIEIFTQETTTGQSSMFDI